MIVFKYRKETGRKGSTIFRPVADIEFKSNAENGLSVIHILIPVQM